MLASGRQVVKKRRLAKAAVDFASLAITKSIQKTYLLRKWYDIFKNATYYTRVSTASTTADECAVETTSGEWAWRPSYPTFPIPPPPSAKTTPVPTPVTEASSPSGGLWLPFLAKKRNTIESGRRFFARFAGPRPLIQAAEQPDAITSESWRQSQSEDTFGLDENIVRLLTMDPSRLPKPCDPLTYCFWKHGLRRHFEPVSATAKTLPSIRNSMTFTVCSYNVLCQRTLGYYLEQLYSHCPFEHLTWQRRWPLLAVELQMLDSDIFCMQEVQEDHFEQDYMPFLSKLGYDGTFKKKLKKKSDGCATFWRRDKFRPVLIHPVELVFPEPHDHSDCVALITVLEPVSRTERGLNSSRVVVANTHLIYQPALGATKLCQAAMLLAHLQKVTRQYTPFESSSPIPLILCGDFNSTPFSPLYSLLIDGQLQYEGLNGWAVSGQQQSNSRYRRLNAIGDSVLGPSLLPEGSGCSELCTLEDSPRHDDQDVPEGCLSHSLNLRSVYDHTTKYGEREVTMFLPGQSVACDYILYSVEDKKIHKSAHGPSAWTTTSVSENGLRCLERYRLPGPTQLQRVIGYLPNQYCASDHLPLMAKFALDGR